MDFNKPIKRIIEEIIWPVSIIFVLSVQLSIPLAARYRGAVFITLLILGIVTGVGLTLMMTLAWVQNIEEKWRRAAAIISWFHLGIAVASAVFKGATVFAVGFESSLMAALIFHRATTGRWLRWKDLR